MLCRTARGHETGINIGYAYRDALTGFSFMTNDLETTRLAGPQPGVRHTPNENGAASRVVSFAGAELTGGAGDAPCSPGGNGDMLASLTDDSFIAYLRICEDLWMPGTRILREAARRIGRLSGTLAHLPAPLKLADAPAGRETALDAKVAERRDRWAKAKRVQRANAAAASKKMSTKTKPMSTVDKADISMDTMDIGVDKGGGFGGVGLKASEAFGIEIKPENKEKINTNQSQLHPKVCPPNVLVDKEDMSTNVHLYDLAQPAPPKAKRKAEMPPIPPALDTAPFRATWGKWVEYRSAKGKPVSPHAAAEQFALCVTLGTAQAIEQINASIRNDWQGIFPPNSGNGSRRSTPTASPSGPAPVPARVRWSALHADAQVRIKEEIAARLAERTNEADRARATLHLTATDDVLWRDLVWSKEMGAACANL